MRGKPFQSKLESHFDFILEARRKRQTWQAIAHDLAGKGIATTPQGVHAFTKRRLKRRYPLGMAPAAMPIHEPKPQLPESPEFSESLTPPSEFGPDPLTLPLKGKGNSGWGVLKPKT
jgi:hypothetical protein